jgi:hypothetical protein
MYRRGFGYSVYDNENLVGIGIREGYVAVVVSEPHPSHQATPELTDLDGFDGHPVEIEYEDGLFPLQGPH